MQIGAGKSGGSAGTKSRRASSPPVEAPITTMRRMLIRLLRQARAPGLDYVFGTKPIMTDLQGETSMSRGDRRSRPIVVGLGASAGGIKALKELFTHVAPDSGIAHHVHIHGDGVKDIAFLVNDCRGVFHESVKRGARPIQEPAVMEDETGQVVKATIGAFGDTVHSFIERKNYEGVHLPDYRPINNQPPGGLTGLVSVDHTAISVEPGTLDKWVSFYEETLGFHQSHQEDVLTEYSAMNSKVVQNSTGSIKFPIVEPAAGKRKSQKIGRAHV
jgi:hypothetical protein